MLPQKFGKTELTEKELKNDRKICIKAGPCGLGRRALYLNTFFLDRRLYACYEDIERIYKRIAMSAGGFSGRGVFAAVPYLVVELKDKRSRQCSFRSEEDMDTLMRWIGEIIRRSICIQKRGRKGWRPGPGRKKKGRKRSFLLLQMQR